MRTYITKANEGALPDSITAEKLGAGEINSFLVENTGAVSSSGQTPAPASGVGEVTDQLSKALSIYGAGGAEFHKDTGAVNAYVLSPVSPIKSPPAYFDGFTVSFSPGNDNTGPSTANVASLGVVDILDISGSPLVGGEISGPVTLRYDDALSKFVLIVFESSIGSGQTWQDVTGSRSINVTYTNTTGRSIMVMVTGDNGTLSFLIKVDGVTICFFDDDDGNHINYVCAIVPPGSTYITGATGTISQWTELR